MEIGGQLESQESRVQSNEGQLEGPRAPVMRKHKVIKGGQKIKVTAWTPRAGGGGQPGKPFSSEEERKSHPHSDAPLVCLSLPQSPREADCFCLLCTALQYTNRLT